MKSGLSIREKQGLERTRHRTSVDAGRRRKRSVMMSIGISAIFFFFDVKKGESGFECLQ